MNILTQRFWIALFACLVVTGVSRGDDPTNPAIDPAVADHLLADERWYDQTIGLSLRPPADAQVQPVFMDNVLLRLVEPGRYSITVRIERPEQEATIAELVGIADAHYKLFAEVLGQRIIKPNGLDGTVVYLHGKTEDPDPKIQGDAYILFSPHLYALITLDTVQSRFEQVAPVFEAMLASIRLEDPADHARELLERKERRENGDKFVKAINASMLHSTLIPAQVLRIVENDKDLGYMTINQAAGKEWNQNGVSIKVQSRIYLTADTAQDTENKFFLSDDQESELWTDTVTVRRKVQAPRQLQPEWNVVSTAKETGVRDHNDITGTRQIERVVDALAWREQGDRVKADAEAAVQAKNEEFAWRKPPTSYLSRVHVAMLGQLLRKHPNQSFGFYAYEPASNKILFHTIRTELKPDGTLVVYKRLRPDLPESHVEYDSTGRILRAVTPGGHTLLATTPEELKVIWQLK